MTNMKKIKKSIEVNAPKERVWDVLLKDEFTRIWYAAFSEGSHADTDWKVGSKAIFTDHSKNGLIAKITANKTHELISMEYQGVVFEGKEDYDSSVAKTYKGGIESYRLSGSN